MESELRLKGDDTYPKCSVCGEPIRGDQNSVAITTDNGPQPMMHEKCFQKWAKEIISSGKVVTERRRDG